VAVVLVATIGARGAQAPAAGRSPDRAAPPAVASYTIAARLEPADHRVHGRQTIRWRNVARRPVSELCFHLYLNAFRSTATTWMRHVERERVAALAPDGWGWIEIQELRAAGVDLTAELAFTAPDDGNPDDRTVARVALPRPVVPGETLDIDVTFLSRLPRGVARTGYHRDFHLVAQWFPKLAVLERDGTWSCNQFHRSSEFFADYGDYDVSLTVPDGFVVGATGRRVASSPAEGGGVTERYLQDGVHDFAWTAWPGFVERRATFAADGLPEVEIRLLLRPETTRFATRHLRALRHALARFGAWYGPYPYSTLTMVDPPWGADWAGGMEYPTFITTRSHVFSPLASQDPEGVTVHELGHQYFYGLLASDEVREPYLDEGITTYATARVLADAYGPETWTFRAWTLPLAFRGVTLEHPLDTSARYFDDPATDPIARTSYGYLDRDAYRSLAYSKMALALGQLERLLGADTMAGAMRAYAREWRFRHPRTGDFVRSLSRASGEDLDGYFRQFLWGSEVLDYAVAKAETRRRRGPLGVFGTGRSRETVVAAEELPGWESEVVVRRLGGASLPVIVDLVFTDGQRARLRWDGHERWVRFRAVGPRLAWAEVDPEETLLLDVDRLNNSRRTAPDRRASRRWGQRVRFWIQNLLETFALLA
jgi:hypothetical protein